MLAKKMICWQVLVWRVATDEATDVVTDVTDKLTVGITVKASAISATTSVAST